MKSHHLKIKSFTCDFLNCGAKFSHKASLKRHCLKAHGGQTENTQNVSVLNGPMDDATFQFGCRDSLRRNDDIHVFIDDDDTHPLRGNLPIKPEELNNL